MKFIGKIVLIIGGIVSFISNVWAYGNSSLSGKSNHNSKSFSAMKSNTDAQYCIQVITHAYNPNTGEEKDFPTPCDVPEGWIVGHPPSEEINSAIDLNSNVEALQEYLYSTSGFEPTGTFTRYDFAGVDATFDWVFVTPNGNVYQLRGEKPTKENLFGWRKVGENLRVCDDLSWVVICQDIVMVPDTIWVMIKLDDWDNDGDKKFDWVLFTPPEENARGYSEIIYKLDGVTKQGTFRYKKIEGMIVRREGNKYLFYYKNELPGLSRDTQF